MIMTLDKAEIKQISGGFGLGALAVGSVIVLVHSAAIQQMGVAQYAQYMAFNAARAGIFTAVNGAINHDAPHFGIMPVLAWLVSNTTVELLMTYITGSDYRDSTRYYWSKGDAGLGARAGNFAARQLHLA